MSFKSSSRIVSERMRSQSDRYHQRRLSEIRHSKGRNIPSFSHVNNSKGAMQEEERKEQIEKENGLLLDKMMHIMEKKPELHTSYLSSRHKKVHPMPDFDYSRERQRISSVKSSYSQDMQRNQWIHSRLAKLPKSRHTHSRVAAQTGDTTPNPARVEYEKSMSLFEGLKAIRDPRQKKELEDKFNKPEQISERVVLYLKSTVSEEGNFLLEISAAYGKLIVLVFDMTKPNKIRRLVLNKEKALQILSEYHYDYGQIAEQVIVSKDSVSIAKSQPQNGLLTNREDEKSRDGSTLKKSPAQQQKEFIQRNFYKQLQKRKKQELLSSSRPPLPQSQNSHRLNISHDIKPTTHEVKPATATNSIRKKFQFQIPQKHKKRVRISALKKGPVQTIEQQKTENELAHTLSKADSFKPKKQGKIHHQISSEKKQMQPKKEASKTEQQVDDKYEQSNHATQHKQPEQNSNTQYDEYSNQFDADYQLKKPQSREKQQRNPRGHNREPQSEDSELKAYEEDEDQQQYQQDHEQAEGQDQEQHYQQDSEGYGDEQNEMQKGDQQNHGQYGEHPEGQSGNITANQPKNSKSHDEGQSEEYGEDFVEEQLKLSSRDKSRPLINARNPHDLYEEDFEISQSKS